VPLRPYDVVEEPLDSGGDLAEDLGGARQRTLDVHAVVGGISNGACGPNSPPGSTTAARSLVRVDQLNRTTGWASELTRNLITGLPVRQSMLAQCAAGDVRCAAPQGSRALAQEAG
jgi:hypothetical protein